MPEGFNDVGSATADLAEHDLERVYAEHHGFVRRTVRALGVPDEAADDVTQDVFMIVHRRLEGFDHRAPIKAWLFGIARNLARKHRERRGRARPGLHLVPAPPASPDDAVQLREAAQTVQRFLDSLDEDKRAVFILAELEGMSAPEVAEALGTKLNTVYSRLRVGRARFAKAIARARAARQRRIGD